MAIGNKLKNASAMYAGRIKANYGRATHDRSLQVRGRWQRVVGAIRQIAQQIKDSGKNIRAALK
jgi:uncharacterized protein YjbJ (UPF0337 family)